MHKINKMDGQNNKYELNGPVCCIGIVLGHLGDGSILGKVGLFCMFFFRAIFLIYIQDDRKIKNVKGS